MPSLVDRGAASPRGSDELSAFSRNLVRITSERCPLCPGTGVRFPPDYAHTFGFHPLYCFLDRPEVSSGEALSGLLRPGNAGSSTADDHKEGLRLALLGSIPAYARPTSSEAAPAYLVRTDSAGASRDFAKECRAEHVRSSFGFPVDERV